VTEDDATTSLVEMQCESEQTPWTCSTPPVASHADRDDGTESPLPGQQCPSWSATRDAEQDATSPSSESSGIDARQDLTSDITLQTDRCVNSDAPGASRVRADHD